jgi:hypothetical protein
MKTNDLQLCELNKEQLSKIYDHLYETGTLLFKLLDPCKWKDGKCARMRSPDIRGIKHSCCSGCKHLKKDGCLAKSLPCKLWLCEYIRNKKEYYDLDILINKLRLIGFYFGLPVNDYRYSKEEFIGEEK